MPNDRFFHSERSRKNCFEILLKKWFCLCEKRSSTHSDSFPSKCWEINCRQIPSPNVIGKEGEPENKKFSAAVTSLCCERHESVRWWCSRRRTGKNYMKNKRRFTATKSVIMELWWRKRGKTFCVAFIRFGGNLFQDVVWIYFFTVNIHLANSNLLSSETV